MQLMVEDFGNAGSRTHVFGEAAQQAVRQARKQLGTSSGADPDDVIFTSGATESDNLAILGLADFGRAEGRRHIVSTAIEHKAVLEPLARLAAEGFTVTLVSPDSSGYVSAQDVLEAVRPDTLLVSVMHANNETGALQPIEAIANELPSAPYYHVDAAQTFGREPLALQNQRIDLISVSAHKIFGPKGVGALIARRRKGRRAPLKPLMVGGGQERGFRPGTQPAALIAGFGLAAEIADAERTARAAACRKTREAAISAFSHLGATVHGDRDRGLLPHIFSVAIPGLDSEAVMVALKNLVAISNGSACTSASYQRSHVLTAMALPQDQVDGTIRLSWSHETEDVPWNEMIAVLDDLRVPYGS
jgi:cysteine desulfurase